MVEGYLLGRANLVRLLVLVDGEIGPTKLDVQLLDWLRHHGRPVTIVASKQDKVKPSKRGTRRRELAAGCGVAIEDVAWVSASTGAGIDELRARIHDWLADGLAASRADAADRDGSPEPSGTRGARLGRRMAAPVVEQNPDGTWPDEDEWN